MAQLSVEPNEAVAVAVLHQDDDVLVVDKPARLVTQPGLGHEKDTLLNGLFARFGPALQNLGAARDYGLLHRLDREASGVLVVALRARAYDALRDLFESREVRKFYWAICMGRPRADSGVVRKPILEVRRPPRPGAPPKKCAKISGGGKAAVTAYRVLSASPGASLVECRPVTGRLHQIRVHLDAIGAPILGDDLYGPPAVRHAAGRLALHAHRLAFRHPVTGQDLDIRSSLPRDMRRLLTRFSLEAPKD